MNIFQIYWSIRISRYPSNLACVNQSLQLMDQMFFSICIGYSYNLSYIKSDVFI